MWFLFDQDRLKAEREAIASLDATWFQNPRWYFDDEYRLALTFELVLAHRTFPLRLTYHNTFPESPPSIHPLDGKARLSSHQYGPGGELCLDVRNDNWTPDVTGADLVKGARRLFEDEAPTEDGTVHPAASAHNVPDELTLRSEIARLYIDPLARLALSEDDIDGLSIEVGINVCSNDGIVAQLLSIGEADASKPLCVPQALREFCAVRGGSIVATKTTSAEVRKVQTLDDLRQIPEVTLALSQEEKWVVLLRCADGTLVLFGSPINDGKLLRYSTVLAPLHENRSTFPRSKINDKKVGLVGLGSLGSKIAVSLARSGVRRFELVDADILHMGNLERHDGDWRDVAAHKATVMARRLKLIRHDVEVRGWRTATNAQVSSQEAANVLRALGTCDLIIDATADPDVFNQLAGLSLRCSRSLVWGSVYGGGVGGEIARARVDIDPCPYKIRSAILEYLQRFDDVPPPTTDRNYDGSVSDGVPLLASDPDVSVIAAHVAGLTIDSLSDVDSSVYDAHAYLVGLKPSWLCEVPFEVFPIVADAPARTSLSPSTKSTVESDFILSLFEERGSEAENSSEDS